MVWKTINLYLCEAEAIWSWDSILLNLYEVEFVWRWSSMYFQLDEIDTFYQNWRCTFFSIGVSYKNWSLDVHKELTMTPTPALVDSGTTLIILPQDLYFQLTSFLASLGVLNEGLVRTCLEFKRWHVGCWFWRVHRSVCQRVCVLRNVIVWALATTCYLQLYHCSL